ncbi:muramoyltetrapeptide carboxypeptidase [Fictibacillus solisalsi]|uniref:Muramoyltetrapeptide carboxypeptidase n=1 Tax=Fictibacillus solisalsi TaxID=459525 RepID=A0A1G9TKR4_9BACL|nr:LD-carboxypeptidase [Fictibacillus solisalsi]SDM48148.1 muramoyltetrapeptide carboxypeptidase [Fictibacillus solisalsi]
MAVRPPILQRGDTIGIVTLGSPLEPARINEGIKTLRSLGFNTVLGKNVYTSTGFLAGTDQQRAADLMAMFSNKNVKMILPTRGGVGVAGILPFLNFNVIRQNPKIVSGYSDITILLNVLYQYADLISFQSLLLLDFNLETAAYNYDQFFLATSTFQSPRQIVNPPGIPQVSRVRGNVTGEVIGGNLTSFVDNLGTPFEIDTTGKILIIEETHEPINTVYRYLNHLKIAGKFADCAGIVMGECTSCEPAYGVNYEQLIREFVIPLGKPLMTNVTTAHGFYKAAIPIGARANLDTVNNRFTILEPSVGNA